MTNNKQVEPKCEQCYLVIGVDTETTQQALVGIADSYQSASDIVGKDYMAIIASKNINPLQHPISSFAGTDNDGYSIKGYTWTFVPVQFNTLLNFAL